MSKETNNGTNNMSINKEERTMNATAKEWTVNGVTYNTDNAIRTDDLFVQTGYLFDDGMLIIDGEGGLGNFSDDLESPYSHDKTSATKVYFTKTVRIIPDELFIDCLNLTGDLIIPDSVVRIGKRAFANCGFYDGQLVLSKKLEVIEEGTFTECSFKTLVLPKNLKEIGNSAFSYCHNLKGDLIIPDNVTKIGGNAFYYCPGLEGKLTLPKSLTEIGNSAFKDCSYLHGDIIIPDNVAKIGDRAFAGCKNFYGKLILPENLKEIGDGTFAGCKFLKGNVLIYDGMITGKNAFIGCDLIKVFKQVAKKTYKL